MWGYGQSIIIDTMLLMAGKLPTSAVDSELLSKWVNPELDFYQDAAGV